jgi:hypothetical protein
MVGYIERVSSEIAALIAREGLDYNQTKAVFKAARRKAGLKAPKEHRGSPARLTLEEELLFIEHAYARSGQVGVMMQALLETGARVSEFVEEYREFRVRAMTMRIEGDIVWHDANSLLSPMRCSTSFWPEAMRKRRSTRTACSTN